MELKNQMVEIRIKPNTTLLSGFEKAGKDDSAMMVFQEMKVQGGCDTAPGYKPKECLQMADRWFSYYFL
ncbi:hypothetical protein Pint_30890 [Pistacia integerrima]|uniref:Uncharacterized protein n=1 Tax=Pistacia integerrima TaxID=434235 RepID=A0ACC0XPN4_9ROSI|nr:hypothetical protein Pint_30890 [Pistacia integerrima]